MPYINCRCEVCTSEDEKDRRLRSAVMLLNGEDVILIDCGPDIRQQLLRRPTDHVTALLLTHEHYDHVAGIDDMRPFKNLQVYALPRVCGILRRNMPYCFDGSYPGVPSLELHEIETEPFWAGHTLVRPIACLHDRLPILGYRIGDFAYLTDVTAVSDAEFKKLAGLDLLVLDALRLTPHHSHFSLSEAIDFASKVKARRTYFTHISHQLGRHEVIDCSLPTGMRLGYDGLSVESY